MTTETRMIIRCNWCENAWDINMGPDTCTCNDDNHWELVVLERETDE